MPLFAPVFFCVLGLACGLFVAFVLGLICWVAYLALDGYLKTPPKSDDK